MASLVYEELTHFYHMKRESGSKPREWSSINPRSFCTVIPSFTTMSEKAFMKAQVNDPSPGKGVSSPFAHAASISNRPVCLRPLENSVAWQQSRISRTSPMASKKYDCISDQISVGPPSRLLEESQD